MTALITLVSFSNFNQSPSFYPHFLDEELSEFLYSMGVNCVRSAVKVAADSLSSSVEEGGSALIINKITFTIIIIIAFVAGMVFKKTWDVF